jgi:1,4-dihydroxy-2-naphthoate octaprenyltransferase
MSESPGDAARARLARAGLAGPDPGAVRRWLLAARVPTLTASVAPVLVGSALAVRDEVFAPLAALVALAGAVAIQVGANLANDVSDFRRGADTEARIGPPRVTQLGLLAEGQVVAGMWIAFGVAASAGLYLTAVAGWPVIAMGLASIAAALAYTGGPWPFGYRGLGEPFTFVFFGVLAVGGTYYVQAGEWTAGVLAASLPVGCTVTAILVVNNVRDIETDRATGKRTLAVLVGRRATRGIFLALVAGAYALAAALWLAGSFSPWVLLAAASLPFALRPALAVLRETAGPPLNAALRGTARLHLLFSVLLALGIAL